ncbi:MAG TPA: hypothetical protein PLX18_05260 [Anaerohalosphaeraceae bacterium]|nr:hypothetical protein [Anaerohalosphaeraceae bacterium]HOT72462.1 hypothetical protein [Anaerohalosphaeraceae bacterium]HPB92589.1 hypothetical protein [Anaerohalosphaeraceae bacterium]HQG05969.1 hypothetical protein [Anaerohalosphaeraceae bacterium]HQI07251.1 hypothetical protein [Anaerohalosphaeraceae bacterium]
MMTKPIVCRVIQSRPLQPGEIVVPTETDLPAKPPLQTPRYLHAFRRWKGPNPSRPKAPKGIWLDCWA